MQCRYTPATTPTSGLAPLLAFQRHLARMRAPLPPGLRDRPLPAWLRLRLRLRGRLCRYRVRAPLVEWAAARAVSARFVARHAVHPAYRREALAILANPDRV